MFTPWSVPTAMFLAAVCLFGWFWSNSLEHRPPYASLKDNPSTMMTGIGAGGALYERTTTAKNVALDVSKLPTTLLDAHSALWWGNALLLAIETAMFGILIAIYFSVMMQTEPFPPPRLERMPVLYESFPDLTLPIIGLAVILASLVPSIYARQVRTQ